MEDKNLGLKPIIGEPYTWIDNIAQGRKRINVKKTSYEKLCPVCNKRVVQLDKFCRECGTKLDWGDFE